MVLRSSRPVMSDSAEKKESERDRVSSTTETVVTAGGAVAGGVTGALFAVGAGTSVPVVTTVASWVGITAVAATPVGWVIGAAALGVVIGGGVTYGIAKLISHNGKMEGKQEADEEARIAETEREQNMQTEKMTYKKVDFAGLGFRCLEPTSVRFLDGSMHTVQAHSYLHSEEIKNPDATLQQKRARKLYSVSTTPENQPSGLEICDELDLEQRIGEASFKDLN